VCVGKVRVGIVATRRLRIAARMRGVEDAFRADCVVRNPGLKPWAIMYSHCVAEASARPGLDRQFGPSRFSFPETPGDGIVSSFMSVTSLVDSRLARLKL
jgi:hypothetical protein